MFSLISKVLGNSSTSEDSRFNNILFSQLDLIVGLIIIIRGDTSRICTLVFCYRDIISVTFKDFNALRMVQNFNMITHSGEF